MTDPEATPTGAAADALEEIAEDLLDLLRRQRAMEEAQQELAARLATIERTLQALRRDLLEERKALAGRHAFDAVAPLVDSLRLTLAGLGEESDRTVRAPIAAVVGSLSNLLQGLGVVAFDVEAGEPFDALRMECLGYADGPPGVVIEMAQPGYRAGETVVRPAGVLIADPSRPAGSSAEPEERAKR